MTTTSRAAEWLWVCLAFLLVSLSYASTQPVRPREGMGEDGQIYHAMAKAMPRELPPSGVAPFVFRLGMPLAAAGVAKSLDWVIAAGFDRLNLAFNALSVILLTILLQRHVPGVFARLVVIVAFMVEPHSPMRLSYLHPLSVDAAVLAGLLAGLVGIEWFQALPSPRRASLLAALVAVGVVFHEVLLIVGLCLLCCPLSGTVGGKDRTASWVDRFRAWDRTGAWLPLISGVTVLAAVHAWVVPTPSDYSVSTEVLRWLWHTSPLRYGLAWLLVFGPALILPVFYWRNSLRILRERPVFVAYVVMCGLWAWLGGGQTERGLAMASPVVYVLIGNALAGSGIGPASLAMAGILAVQGVSSRVFSPIGPIEPPVVLGEVWERLGWADVAWAMSYQNLWSQFCAPAMVYLYFAWYGLTGGAVIAFLWSRSHDLRTPSVRGWLHLLSAWWLSARRLHRSHPRLLVVLGTTTAMTPVVWLALSGFYGNHYAQPGYEYLFYNLARLWLVVILLMAFLATGSRIVERGAVPLLAPRRWRHRFTETAFTGAAAWSVAVVLLAALHLYYVWVILPVLAAAVAAAIFDLVAALPDSSSLPRPDSTHAGRWGFIGLLLRLGVAINAIVILVTIALWGHFGGDNDVPGNYLPYYETVLRAHSIAPNGYWVHYFASKGNGLGFLANVLSDVNGAALATYLVLLLGAGMIWRLSTRYASVAPAIGLIGVCLYLQYYAGQGAYAKSHIIRNTFILYLVLSSVRSMCFPQPGPGTATISRLVVITAVIVLSPLAVVLLLPILLVATVVVALSGQLAEARRSLVEPAWAIVATAVVCTYNFFIVGVPELHSMPSLIARFVDLERFRRWIDPDLAYVDYRLGFLKVALPGNEASNAVVTIAPVQSLGEALPGVLNTPILVFIAGAALTGALAVALFRGRPGAPSERHTGPVFGIAYLLSVLVLISGLRMFGGGPGSSMGRFTDFANPLGIALGVVILTTAWTLEWRGLARRVLAVAIFATAGAAIYLGSASVWALPWRASGSFLIGQSSYASMNEGAWDTQTAHRVAQSVPEGALVEMVNFLPGFTAIPATPFQRPDGCVYLKDYTAVIYGSAEQAAAIYAESDIRYFLFDVSSDAPVVWSGLSPLFTPESIKSRMQLVGRYGSATRDLYLLTWGHGGTPPDREAFEKFLQKWRDKLAWERQNGYFHGSYDEGARLIGLRK